MNLRDLDYIRAVARHEHFGRAAEACKISQPALSTQVKKLEEELGVALFERDNRSVRLTEVGRQIVGLADQALSVVDNIRAVAHAASDPLSGTLRFGSIPTITPYLVPHFLGHVADALPRLNLQIREDITSRLTQDLLDNNLDAALLATPNDNSHLDTMALYDEPFWAIFPSTHDLKGKHDVRIADLPQQELLLLSDGHCFRDQTLSLFGQPTGAIDDAVRATSLETLLNMVVAGQGVTLAPATALDGGWINDTRIGKARLADSCAKRRVYLTFRKHYPRRLLLDRIADLIRDHLPGGLESLANDES